ncbi:glycosyltransferase family 4 protein [Polaribacter sejongensis]|uniref:glycosyltransferase family 4 protein n=1 Tax=Polaribacter sejongensis TaxID=985043 RepID=UPI0035A635C2
MFLGAFYSKIYNIKHIWHVHEIIQHPKMVAKAYPFLVDWFSDCVVFNSVASAEHLYKNKPKLKEKSTIIYNGLDRNVPISSKEEQMLLRNSLFKSIDKSSIVIGLVGRINRHKGQQLLLSVFNELKKNPENNIYLLFVGSTIKSQLFLLEELKDEIKNKNLENFVTIVDFQKEIWKFYDCIDIVLVPTTDIESFGLVAIEGMLSKKPVIASNHGGLKEIVIHNTTGLLFEPNNASDLKKSIESLLINQNLIELYGKEGEKRAKFDFSLEKYVNNFKALYNSF